MNPIKSPYDMLLERMGLQYGNPTTPVNGPQDMMAEMIAAGHPIQRFKEGNTVSSKVVGDPEKRLTEQLKENTAAFKDINLLNPNYTLGVNKIAPYSNIDALGTYHWSEPGKINVTPYAPNLSQVIGHEAQHSQYHDANVRNAADKKNRSIFEELQAIKAGKVGDELYKQAEENYKNYVANYLENPNNQKWSSSTMRDLGAYHSSYPGRDERLADYAGLEAQLPKGKTLMDTELGKAVFNSPELQAWLYSSIRPLEPKAVALNPKLDNTQPSTLEKMREELRNNVSAGRGYLPALYNAITNSLK